MYEFGRFTTDDNSGDIFTIHSDIIPPDGSANTTSSHPLLGKCSLTEKLGDTIHKDTSDKLCEFLKLRRIDQKNRLARDIRKNTKRVAAMAKDDALNATKVAARVMNRRSRRSPTKSSVNVVISSMNSPLK